MSEIPRLDELKFKFCQAYPRLSGVDVYSAQREDVDEGFAILLENKNIRDVLNASYSPEVVAHIYQACEVTMS